ncbi:hypothetical protein [Sulfidibacter corallicola]|uniref:Uncharacterized protein n=1 Tax=Sulfidibacter corallicola TaxID=2818388 RepID=A0A8A4TEB6_SULCO|nr:hypothetical protein [Sulfidibacter corallicola]QTD47963.1 hypothetical protein J3U87_20445 [Sulfidibacter corallicola]
MILLTLLELFFKWRYIRHAGQLRCQVRYTLVNYLIAGLYTFWLAIAQPFRTEHIPILILFICVSVLALVEILSPLKFREGGISNALFRVPWAHVKDWEWRGNRLRLHTQRGLILPDTIVWKIPESRLQEIEDLLQAHVPEKHLNPEATSSPSGTESS